jgi:hypothetical protein
VKKKPTRRAGVQPTVLRQLVECIPAYLVAKLARKHGVDEQARTFTPWSHVVALLYAQLSHALSLNDVCDGLRLWATPLRALRGATPPSRNALSHANKIRDCGMAQALFWQVLEHLQGQHPGFGRGQSRGLAWRFRRTIHVLDATVIQLLASCLSWAEHNHRKAAAKVHLRLSLRSLLPGFVVVGSAIESEIAKVRLLCAGLKAGEIVLFDKGYHQLAHFWELTQRSVFFVTRPKEGLLVRVVRRRSLKGVNERVLADEEIVLVGKHSRAYRCRWQIEAFFKQIKQTLQLADFLGHSANAVQWQVWMALLVYVLLRFQAWCSRWAHSFSRLLTVLRAALWQRRDLAQLLRRYGTAEGSLACLAGSRQSWLPGLTP